MPFQAFTEGVPNPPNFPAVDVNTMLQNNLSINRIFSNALSPALDNIGFNDQDGGYHFQVSMPNEDVPALPGFNKNPGGVLFSNNPGGAGLNPGWPYWLNNLGNFQLTGSAANNNPNAAANGYSFLPGGLLIQWGTFNFGAAAGTLLFATANINFPNNCFNVQATLFTQLGIQVNSINVGTFTVNGFNYQRIGGGGPTGFNWIAIGN